MAHFPSLDALQRARLAAMGVDPEKSCEGLLEAVRAGDVPPRLVAALGAAGTPKRPYFLGGTRRRKPRP